MPKVIPPVWEATSISTLQPGTYPNLKKLEHIQRHDFYNIQIPLLFIKRPHTDLRCLLKNIIVFQRCLRLHLAANQSGVCTIFDLDEIIVRSLFHDLSVLDYKYTIGTADLFERQERSETTMLRVSARHRYCHLLSRDDEPR
jgi:hypothetical protein